MHLYLLIIRLFLARTDCEDYAECHAQQGRKEHAVLARKHEGDGVSRIPEERNGLLKNKSPLAVPVECRDKATHGNGGDERLERAAALRDMCVGNLMECHKHGREEGVHHHRD